MISSIEVGYRGFKFREHPVGCMCKEHSNCPLEEACVTAWYADHIGKRGYYQAFGRINTRESAADIIISKTNSKLERVCHK